MILNTNYQLKIKVYQRVQINYHKLDIFPKKLFVLKKGDIITTNLSIVERSRERRI